MARASLCILRSSAKFLTFCATPAELSRIPLIVQGRPTCRSTPLLAAPAPPSTERRHGSNYGIEGPCTCSFFANSLRRFKVGKTEATMGPLTGFRIVEFAGIGPGPMAAMLFADLGASIIRLDRMTPSGLGVDRPARFDLIARARPSVAVDLKHPDGLALAADLIGEADALIEGFRPGTMERLGLGPEAALARNPRLVYGRITGWGQSGPLAQAAGHDLNYLALTGALAAIGRAGSKPTPPLNLVADFGGGALYLAFGMACAMVEAQRSGQGQVVDAAMTEGAASLMTIFYGLHAAGLHSLERGTNLLDSRLRDLRNIRMRGRPFRVDRADRA